MGEITQNIREGEELEGTADDVDDAMGHSSESEYSDNMETHEDEMVNDNTIGKANDNKKRRKKK